MLIVNMWFIPPFYPFAPHKGHDFVDVAKITIPIRLQFRLTILNFQLYLDYQLPIMVPGNEILSDLYPLGPKKCHYVVSFPRKDLKGALEALDHLRTS